MTKLAMIGLDAAELSFIEAHLPALPSLRRMLHTAAPRRLESPADLLPGAVWPTFFTGTSPGEHGIYHHLQWDAQRMRLRRVSADWLPCEPFWVALERRGTRVLVLDVPMTFPSRLHAGTEVTNWGSHDQLGPFACHPPALAREIRQRFGSHPMGYEIPVRKTARELERIRANLVAGALRKGKLARWLLATREWDFFLAVFGEPHRGGHILWPEDGRDATARPDALLTVYQAVDEALGAILDALGDTDVRIVVFSLHGMGPNTSQEHFVPQIMDRVNAGLGSATRTPGGEPAQRGVVRWLRESVPARLQNAVARAMPVWVRDLVVDRSITAGHDWERTPGVDVLSDLNGYLRFNLRGREARGMLEDPSSDLARYEERVRQAFLGCRAEPSGAPLVARVRRPADEYPGVRANVLPDLVVTWTGDPPVAEINSTELGHMRAELTTGRAGNHRPDGFCVVLGEPASGWAVTDIAQLGQAAGHLAQLS